MIFSASLPASRKPKRFETFRKCQPSSFDALEELDVPISPRSCQKRNIEATTAGQMLPQILRGSAIHDFVEFQGCNTYRENSFSLSTKKSTQ